MKTFGLMRIQTFPSSNIGNEPLISVGPTTGWLRSKIDGSDCSVCVENRSGMTCLGYFKLVVYKSRSEGEKRKAAAAN